MVGRNFTDDSLVDLHWSNPAGPDVLVEIRRQTLTRIAPDAPRTAAA